MERRITETKIIQQFTSGEVETIRGIYECKFKGETTVFVRKGDKIYVVRHMLEKPELCLIRDDVRDELLLAIEETIEV
jgi:hypothetical protein